MSTTFRFSHRPNRAAEIRYGQIPELERSVTEASARLDALQAEQKMLKEEVDEEDVAEVVSKWTGVPVSRLMEGELQKLLHLEEHLHERVVGQYQAVAAVAYGTDTIKPALKIVGHSHGYLRGDALRAKVDEINALAPDFLWVALGVCFVFALLVFRFV